MRNALFNQLYRIREKSRIHKTHTVHSRRPSDTYLMGYDEERRMLPPLAEMRERILRGETARGWLDGHMAPWLQAQAQAAEKVAAAQEALLAIGDGSEVQSAGTPAGAKSSKAKKSRKAPARKVLAIAAPSSA